MFAKIFWCLTSVIICIGNNNVNSLTPEEKTAITNFIMPPYTECIEEKHLTPEDLQKIKKHQPDMDYCFVSCVLKKIGIFNGEGKYDVEEAMALTKNFVKNEKDVEALSKLKHECGKVNDEQVSDGDKGCDRAKLLLKCLKEHNDELPM